jgi:phosphoribosyl 1,2-cyclic phosphodiesterase
MTMPIYKLRFWGVRGTVPTPEADKLRYGGHTSCLAVDLGDREHLVLDCGTGIRLLGNQQAQRPGPQRYHIFFTHYHLDHLIGLPFFHPLYDKDSTIVFHGFATGSRSVREILQGVMSPPYFPVELRNVPAAIEYVTDDRSPVRIGGLTVSSLALNHPDGCLSYRLEHGDRRIVYATDHEHGQHQMDRDLVEFSAGADYLIYDAMYQETEYERLRRGWGHSTWYAAVQAALAAGAKHLVLFHHHPEHTDEELEKLLGLAREEMPETQIAAEGMELPL